ncbi:hypothetical protein [Xanthomonas vesicatoria]|uniref:hypothetical protein n=1 Tax=Xanthomonas vesicatoria TaxID=56460 RepID=UPI001E2D5100|nr:hypothetical protein [Xanthomonas vesicatoria]MCC8617671.1 hypothetical protein [Xanthomonas vesicatoria]MCC8629696.1 hypothetical protein [Xanthomonas vesicatoria]
MLLNTRSYLETESQPWSRDQIERAYFADFVRTPEVIEETAGGQLWRSLNDLEDTLWILQQSVTELFDEISLFSERSAGPGFWNEVNVELANRYARSVKRCIFNCTSSVMALVDHARRFESKYPTKGYKGKVVETFPSNGLHEFLQRLRNYNTHWRIAEANWMITHDFKRGVREASFVMEKKELLRWSDWNAGARAYLANAPETIDIRQVFSDYRRSVQHFYEWHRGEVISQYADSYQPYLEYKRIVSGIRKRILWNDVLSQSRVTSNPYVQLAKYIPKHQVENLLALDGRIDKQVESLMEMVCLQEFCDSDLRGKALAFFQRKID